MVASPDSHGGKDVVTNGQKKEAPPREEIRNKREWDEEVENDDWNNVGPKHFAIRGDPLGFRNPRLANSLLFNVNVFRNRVCFGRFVRNVFLFGLSFSSHGFFVQIVEERG